MPAFLLTAPALEPLSLLDAKSFLRVEHDADDVLIASLVSAARNHVEAMARSALIAQTWRLVLDRWPDDGRIAPRIGPLRALSAARVFDQAGEGRELDPDTFVVDRAANVIAAPGDSVGEEHGKGRRRCKLCFGHKRSFQRRAGFVKRNVGCRDVVAGQSRPAHRVWTSIAAKG